MMAICMNDLKIVRDVARKLVNNVMVLEYFLTQCDRHNERLLKDCQERIAFMRVDYAILKSAMSSVEDERINEMKPFYEAVTHVFAVLDNKGKTNVFVHACKQIYGFTHLVFVEHKAETAKREQFLQDWIEKHLPERVKGEN